MAVDTAKKRFAMLGMGLSFGGALPPPDGTNFNVDDRMFSLGLYSGIDMTPPGGAGDGGTSVRESSRGLLSLLTGR